VIWQNIRRTKDRLFCVNFTCELAGNFYCFWIIKLSTTVFRSYSSLMKSENMTSNQVGFLSFERQRVWTLIIWDFCDHWLTQVSHTRWLEKNSGQYVRLYTSSYFPTNYHLHSETHFCCESILLYRSFCYKKSSNIDLDSKHW